MECNHHRPSKPYVPGQASALCINNVPILDILSPEEKIEVMNASISKQYTKGEAIFSPGHSSANLWIVHRGSVKISRFSPAGKEQIVRILSPGDFTGELSLFSHAILTNTAEALEPTEICLIQGKVISDLMLRNPQIAIKFLEKYTERIEMAEDKLEQLTLYDVEQRIAKVLMEMLHDQQNDHLQDNVLILPVSKKDLAVMIGTTQESLSRKLALFQERGWIKLTGQRQIIIVDQTSLKQLNE
ncbi:Crp/Fnr family transcriptional regulator [Paenibacillus tepidiphilus]|uniref:Crp/Fnr family transcriptional regulator n=1 Tax=Paenibacillus tepidiphilus TaxID=2608683 RepID=UPI0012399BB8|nr:Crp/Fnr family transcriptional regulator [Paenibacillus tepidiphilus]